MFCLGTYLDDQRVKLAYASGEVQGIQRRRAALAVSRNGVCCWLTFDHDINNTCLQVHNWGPDNSCVNSRQYINLLSLAQLQN